MQKEKVLNVSGCVTDEAKLALVVVDDFLSLYAVVPQTALSEQRCLSTLMWVQPHLYQLNVGETASFLKSVQSYHYLMFCWINKDVPNTESSSHATGLN